MDTVRSSVKKTGRAVVVHEGVNAFGVGAEVSSRIHESLFRELKAPVARVASNDSPVPYAPPHEVFKGHGGAFRILRRPCGEGAGDGAAAEPGRQRFAAHPVRPRLCPHPPAAWPADPAVGRTLVARKSGV